MQRLSVRITKAMDGVFLANKLTMRWRAWMRPDLESGEEIDCEQGC